MSVNKLTFLVLSVIFLLLAMVFLGSIIFILYKNKQRIIKENELKSKYNELLMYDLYKKMIPIEHMGFNNARYESIVECFNNFRSKYENEMIVLKEKIMKMPEALNLYDWKNFDLMYKSIHNDITQLEESIRNIDSIYETVLQYRNYISYLNISYRDNTKLIVDFYNKELINTKLSHDNNLINNLCDKLKDIVIKINGFIELTDINEIMQTFGEFNINFSYLLELLYNYYLRSQEIKYIDSCENEIEKILSNSNYNISEQDHNFAQKSLTKIRKNKKTLYKRIETKEFNNIENITRFIISEFYGIRSTLQINLKFNKFLDSNKQLIIDSLTSFCKETEILKNKTQEIYENFSNSETIKNECINLVEEINRISKSIRNFVKKENDKNMSNDSFLKESKILIQRIISWCDGSEMLINNVNDKYHYFKEILTSITSNKLLLTQMIGFIKENKIENITLTKDIEKLIKEFDFIQMNFFRNYDSDFEYNYNYLSDLKQQVSEINLYLSYIYFQKKYVERLIFYMNLQMAKYDVSFNFENAIKLYEEGRYKESIFILIKQIKAKKHKTNLHLYLSSFSLKKADL